MSFKISQLGFKKVRLALQRIQQTAPRMMAVVADEANQRHARTYRRRTIPVDTGRLRRSLTDPASSDRLVLVQKKGITIGSLVPYAMYQRHRIRELNRTELQDVFVQPVMLLLQEVLAGRRT